MSAHRIYCFGPQRAEAIDFLESVGAIITPDVPHVVDDARQLAGLDHITFITVDNHPTPIPQPMWETIVREGAIVIHVDNQYRRSRAAARVPVKHYPGVASEAEPSTAAR